MGTWKKEYNNNRKQFAVGLNKKEVLQFEKTFKKSPSVKFIKEILFNKEIVITTRIVDKSKDDLTYQLKKIGNNINQIAWKLNTNSDVFTSDDIKNLQDKLSSLQFIISQV